jgi:hypothetical protein
VRERSLARRSGSSTSVPSNERGSVRPTFTVPRKPVVKSLARCCVIAGGGIIAAALGDRLWPVIRGSQAQTRRRRGRQ